MRSTPVLAVVALVLLAPVARATELPHNEPTTPQAELLRRLDERALPDKMQGFVHIPDQKARVLIQPAGRMFRDIHTRVQPWLDAALIVIALASMAALYVFFGSMYYHPDPLKRRIKRFNLFERFTHWMTATCFILLALTGLNEVFGRWLIQPWLGDLAFSTMTSYGKLAHDFLGFPFILGVGLMFVLWLAPNIPNKLDWTWIKMGGGMFGGEHPPARKFNAGQKMIYWSVVLGGGLLGVTGILLLLPFIFTGILGMQTIQVAHSLIAAVMIAVIIGHIYLGTAGVRGSFDAMATGTVDLSWAREHHPLWVAEEEEKGHVPPGLYPAE